MPVFTSEYSTVTPADGGYFSSRNKNKCEGYDEWIDASNAMMYRDLVLMGLLNDSVDADWEGIDLEAMEDEALLLIRRATTISYPEELKELRDEDIAFIRNTLKLIRAAQDYDVVKYNDLIKERHALQDESIDDPNAYIRQQCGL